MKTIYGQIRSVDYQTKIITILYHHQIYSFQFTNRLFSQFKQYLDINYFIILNYEEDNIKNRVQVVESIKKIIVNTPFKRIVLFDSDKIKEDLTDFIHNQKYLMFVDFEFTMPPYEYKKSFFAEIIQYGICLENQNYQLIDTDTNYVTPIIKEGFNKRVMDFLQVDSKVMKKAINFKQFYKMFNYFIDKYQPKIFTWGVNDKLNFKKNLDRHHINSKRDITFVDYMAILKNIFQIKRDIGLNKLYNYLKLGNHSVQKHDALTDSMMLMKIYNEMSKRLDSNNEEEFKKLKKDILELTKPNTKNSELK